MIVKIISKAAAADYAEREDHDAVLVTTTLGSAAIIVPADQTKPNTIFTGPMKAEYDRRAAMRPDIAEPYYHLAVSYHPQDKVTPEIMAADSQSLIHALVASENQYRATKNELRGSSEPDPVDHSTLLVTSVQHRDHDHPHLHLVICRVDAQGRVYHGAHNVAAAQAWCRQKEIEHDFFPVMSKGVPRIAPLSPQDEVKAEITELAVAADQNQSYEHLVQDLTDIGLRLEPKVRGRGWSIVDEDGTKIPASRLGLGGHLAPDRLGVVTPEQEARETAWEVRGQATSLADFSSKVKDRGFTVVTASRQGVVRPVALRDSLGRKHALTDLGFAGPLALDRQPAGRWTPLSPKAVAKVQWASQRRAGPQAAKPPLGGPASPLKPMGRGKVKLVPKETRSPWQQILDLANERDELARQASIEDQRQAFQPAKPHAHESMNAIDREVGHPSSNNHSTLNVVDDHQLGNKTKNSKTNPTPAQDTKRTLAAEIASGMDFLRKLRKDKDLDRVRSMLKNKGCTVAFDQKSQQWVATRGKESVVVRELKTKEDVGGGLKFVDAPKQDGKGKHRDR